MANINGFTNNMTESEPQYTPQNPYFANNTEQPKHKMDQIHILQSYDNQNHQPIQEDKHTNILQDK
jgi:hypothetical protein